MWSTTRWGRPPIYARSLRCLKRRGTLALFGGASGAVNSVNPLDLAEAGSVFLTRPHRADHMRDAEEIAARADDLFAQVGAGRLKVSLQSELPLGEAKRAHDTISGRGTHGKLPLRVADAA